MAIFHCSIKVISRSGGRSAVSAEAYRAGEKLKNDETGQVHDYTHKSGIVMSEIILPEHAPERLSDRQTLWNEVQSVEKRSDAQLAREVEVAFPVEMTRDEQIECVRDYIRENFVSEGMVADWALHDKGDGNPHAHIMLTMRGFDEDGEWTKKQKSVFANSRDSNGKAIYDPSLPSYDPKDREGSSQYRIPALDKDGNQKTRVREGKGTEYLWEKVSIPANDWNDHSKAEIWRASWADHCNRYLTPENMIDHRSYERQGSCREATIHEGVTARQMEREGAVSDRCEYNRGVKERNSIRDKLSDMAKEIMDLIIGKVRGIHDRYKELAGSHRDRRETGRNDFADGDASIGEREIGTGTVGEKAKDKHNNNGDGQAERLEREIEQREQEFALEAQRAEQARLELKTREDTRDERVRKLMERRRATGRDGINAGSDRVTASGETADVIRDIRASINAATVAEKNSGTERAYLEAEQRRHDLERERTIESRSIRRKNRGMER